MHEINMITLSTLLYADKDDYRVRTSYFLFILFPFNFYRPSITMIALRPSLKYLIAFHALNQENKTKLKCCDLSVRCFCLACLSDQIHTSPTKRFVIIDCVMVIL